MFRQPAPAGAPSLRAVHDLDTPRGAHRDGRPVPRWATVAAHAIALVTIPSGLWRIFVALGFTMGLRVGGAPPDVGGWDSVYIVSLSIVAEGTALLTLGLVRPWGERVPRWIPLIGGRRIPPMAVVVPAAVGAVVLQVIWAYAFRNGIAPGVLDFTGDGWRAVMVAAYAPLLLWAPLLGAVTYAYWRRRCRD